MNNNFYYENQLEKLETSEDKTLNKIKLTSPDGQTNWMDLNKESANAVIKWLNNTYNHQPTPTN